LDSKIVLNAHELQIHEAIIKASETKTESTIKARDISYDPNNRTATLDFGTSIKHDCGKSVLTMRFDGILNNAMAGFYRSAYVDEKGEKKYMFSTQCEVPTIPMPNHLSPNRIAVVNGRPAMHDELSLGTGFQGRAADIVSMNRLSRQRLRQR